MEKTSKIGSKQTHFKHLLFLYETSVVRAPQKMLEDTLDTKCFVTECYISHRKECY